MSESFSGRQGGKEKKQEETEETIKTSECSTAQKEKREEVEEGRGRDGGKKGIDLIRRWEKRLCKRRPGRRPQGRHSLGPRSLARVI